MRIFALSTKPLWHGVCVPTGIMAQGRITFSALIAIGFILVFPYQIPAQQSTAPPSSLSTRPLAPESTESELRPSCVLCRKPEGRPGSDLRPQRLHRDKELHPQKKSKERHRSREQAMKSVLTHSAVSSRYVSDREQALRLRVCRSSDNTEAHWSRLGGT